MKIISLPTSFLSGMRYGFLALLLTLLCEPSFAQSGSRQTSFVEESEEEVVESEVEVEPIGIELGDFHYRDVRSSEGVKLRISFTLFAEVKQENENQFMRVYENSVKRIRDQVIIAIRLSETHDFQEPSLAKLKRRMKIRLHRVLPHLEIEDLMLRDFTYFTDTD